MSTRPPGSSADPHTMEMLTRLRPRAERGWLAAAAGAVILAACIQEPPSQAAPRGAPPPGREESFVFRCEDDFRFTVRISSDTAIVRFGDEEAVLPHVVSASGARYSTDGITFWSRGLVALLEAPGLAYSDCVGQAVRSNAEAAALIAGDAPTGIPLAGAEWRLMSLGGMPAIPGADGALPSLSFDGAEMRVTGSAGCNHFMGSFSAAGEALRLAPLAATRMACPSSHAMDQEERLLQALEEVRGYLVWGEILTLFDGEGRSLARFTAAEG